MPSTATVRRAQKAEREETKKSEARDKAKKDADDAYWAAAGDGKKSKAAQRAEQTEGLSLATRAHGRPNQDLHRRLGTRGRRCS